MITNGSAQAKEPQHSNRRLIFMIAVLMIIGFVLRSIQYASAVSLWHDELALALNFQKHSLLDLLTKPLDYKQVAPIGFILAVKIASNIFGVNEHGLRFLSLLFGIASIPLFVSVAKRFVSGNTILAGLGLFVVSPALIWYSATVKPYGCDITVTLLLVLLTLQFLERNHEIKNAFMAGIIGGIALLFSQSAVFTAFLLCIILVIRWLINKPEIKFGSLAILCSCWALGAGITTTFSILLLNPETSKYMHEFWTARGGFPPPLNQFTNFLLWFPGQLFSVFAHFLIYITPPILVLIFVVLPAALAVIGFLVYCRKEFLKIAILVTPIIAGLIAAAAGILPFRHRVGVYAGWPILILAMLGILALYRLPRRAKFIPVILSFVMAVPLMLTIIFAERPPYFSQESKQVLMKVQQQIKPGDKVYVFCGAQYAMEYYGPKVGLNNWTQGGCYYDEPQSFKTEAERFRGMKRFWFFYTQSNRNQAQLLKNHFESIGRLLHSVPDPAGNTGELETAAYLFDLSDN